MKKTNKKPQTKIPFNPDSVINDNDDMKPVYFCFKTPFHKKLVYEFMVENGIKSKNEAINIMIADFIKLKKLYAEQVRISNESLKISEPIVEFITSTIKTVFIDKKRK